MVFCLWPIWCWTQGAGDWSTMALKASLWLVTMFKEDVAFKIKIKSMLICSNEPKSPLLQ